MRTAFSLQLLLLLAVLGCSRAIPLQDDIVERTILHPPAARTSSETREAETELDSPLSLEDALAATLLRNPNLSAATWRIEQAEWMLALSRSRFWPRLGFFGQYMQGEAPSSYLFKKIDQRLLPANVDFNDPGWFENFETALQGEINLFNGFNDITRKRLAEKDIAIAARERERVENELRIQVIEAFYNILAARDFAAIAGESVDTVAEQLRIMRVRYRGGAVVKPDVLSMEVRLAQAREQLVSSRNRLRLAQASLSTLMGYPPSFLHANGIELAPAGDILDAIPTGYDRGVLLAIDNRPELAAMRLRLDKSRLHIRSAKSAYLPRVDLFTRYYHDDPALDYDADRGNWTAALALNWDLFTGFSRQAKVERARAMAAESSSAVDSTLLEIQLDVKNAYLALEEAQSRHEVARSSIASAEESFRLVREHYQGGAVTITRFLEAELDRNMARIRATAARYDTIKARAGIARAVGLWSESSSPTSIR